MLQNTVGRKESDVQDLRMGDEVILNNRRSVVPIVSAGELGHIWDSKGKWFKGDYAIYRQAGIRLGSGVIVDILPGETVMIKSNFEPGAVLSDGSLIQMPFQALNEESISKGDWIVAKQGNTVLLGLVVDHYGDRFVIRLFNNISRLDLSNEIVVPVDSERICRFRRSPLEEIPA